MVLPPHLLSPTGRVSRRRWGLDVRTLGGAVVLVFGLRVVLGGVGLVVSARFPQTEVERQVSVFPGGVPFGRWFERVAVWPWMRYDANWYAQIVEHGYRRGEGTAAFHPLYPGLAVPFAWLGMGSGLALLFVATVASVVLCVLFSRYVALAYGEEYAQVATWLLFTGPLGFVLLAPYSESTFLVFSVASLFALRCERWWLAGVMGGLAAMTRQQGLALVLPLGWGVVCALRERRVPVWVFGAVALVPFGYGLVVAYRLVVLGEAEVVLQARGLVDAVRMVLISRSAEEVAMGQYVTWPWVPLVDEVRLVVMRSQRLYMVVDLVLGWVGAVVVVMGWRVLHDADRLYGLAVVGLALCYYNGVLSPYMALPRHVLIAVPLFVVLARWVGGGRGVWWVQVGLVGNLLLLGMFVLNGWIP